MRAGVDCSATSALCAAIGQDLPTAWNAHCIILPVRTSDKDVGKFGLRRKTDDHLLPFCDESNIEQRQEQEANTICRGRTMLDAV